MRRMFVLAAVVAALSIGLEVALHDDAHASLPWHAVPGFDLAFGMAGCFVIVEVSKALGKLWLQRRDN